MKNTLFLFTTLLLIAFVSCSDGSNDIPDPIIRIDSGITSNGIYCSNQAGERAIDFTTYADWTLSITDDSWCVPSETNGSKGKNTVTFTIKENTTKINRSVFATINSGNTKSTFKIVQQAESTLSIIEIDDIGGEIEVDVTTNSNYQIEIEKSAKSWISQSTTRTLTTKKHHFTIAPYKKNSKREGTITFIYKDFKQVVRVIQSTTPYITFTAKATTEFKWYGAIDKLEYSLNNGKWISLPTYWSITFGGKHGTLRLRGKSSIGTNDGRISFGYSTPVVCSGDIRTLVDYENYNYVDTSNATFCYLFSDCSNLTTAPDLLATALAPNCYKGMFAWCTNLTAAPKLPATTLAPNCYDRMFYNCSSLINAPELPATTLASNCYYEMFESCTGLTAAPELPATTLAPHCYDRMFYNCSSLITAPKKLPATTLAPHCYDSMFANCINLTAAPKLPATTLADYCYKSMFFECDSLITAPELPATTLAEGCYQSMFHSCGNLTAAPKLPATTLAPNCYDSMFASCINLTAAPKLPATTLAPYCYDNMFYNCRSLITAPNLPATTLAQNCYDSMFVNCINLTAAPKLPATTLAPNCYEGMFYGCENITAAPKLPATTLAPYCYASMFKYSNLTTSPELPATTLADYCYYSMFSYCKNLNKVTMLATDITATDALYFWLDGVSSTGTFIKAAEMNDLSKGDNGIPKGWTVKNYGE